MPKVVRTSNDYRKLQTIKKDLLIMRKDLCPDEKEKALDVEMKGFDDFQRKKHELNSLLTDVRTDVGRLNEMRKKLGDGKRDDLTIRLANENNQRLLQATKMLGVLKKVQGKEEKNKKISEKDLADRHQMLILLAKEIQSLTNENSTTPYRETEEDAAMRLRVEARKLAKEEKTKVRREQDHKKKKGRRGKKDGAIDDSEFVDVSLRSEQELAFEAQVQQNIQEQEVILTDISIVLTSLGEIAQQQGKLLKVQGEMLIKVEEGIDSNIAKFKSANKQLKNILEQSGGMSRWCPMLICAIVLLALIGVIFKIA